MSKEILEAVRVLEREKGISSERLMAALEDALLSAYKKTPGAARYARVDMARESGDFKVYELLIPADLEERLLSEVETEEPTVDPETGEMREPPEPELDPEMLAQYRDQIEERDVTPEDFGRIAAQTAKQVILQRIREAERDMMFEEYQDRVGELITGIVQQSDSRYTLVQLRERVEALLPKSEQVDNERYDHGQRIKAIITDVSAQAKGPSIIVSRRSPELIRKLFELEVPEIADGLVEIQNVAREPGYRSKIAVVSHAGGVDPVGACVGPRGSRVRMVVSELRGEKIDIIPFNEEPARFVAKALSPARVREVLVDDENKQATVIVPDDQLSLAIGKEGQNARLAARLTGWRVDIRSETEFAKEEAEHGYQEEEVAGRCAAIMSTGRRCPNAALPGSRYCGLPAHQALVDAGTDKVAEANGDAPEAEEQVAEAAGRRGAGGRGVAGGGARGRGGRRGACGRACRRGACCRDGRRARGGATPTARRRRNGRRRGGPAQALRRLRAFAPEAGAGSLRAWAERDRAGRRGAASRPRRLSLSAPAVRREGARHKWIPAVLPRADPGTERDHRLHSLMAKKRVHEIAKERGISSKEVLAILQKAGLDVKAAASSVDEGDVQRAFSNGADAAKADDGAANGAGAAEGGGRRRPEAEAGPAERAAAARRRAEAGSGPGVGTGRAARAASPAPPRSGRRRWRRWRTPPARRDRLAGISPPAGRPTGPAAAAPPRTRAQAPHALGRARPHGGARAAGRGAGDADQLRRHRQGGRRVARPRRTRGDQEADGARRDGHAHPDAV